MFKLITKFFGTKSERDIKEVLPYVDKTNQEYAKLKAISDDELREKSKEVRKYIDDQLKEIDTKIQELQARASDNPDLDIFER